MSPIVRFVYLLLLTLPQAYCFVHPGLLVSSHEISRAQQNIAIKQNPWFSSWNKLISIKYTSASYTNNAVSIVDRATNGDCLWHDAAAAFALTLRWKISGDVQYADTAARILIAWAEHLHTLGGGDDKYLTAGLQGYELANAAELLRDYQPFQKSGLAAVIKMLTTVILPLNEEFLNHGVSSEHNVRHFYANWELCNIASAMAIGVLADNRTTWDFAVNYFKNGTGNGAIRNAIPYIVREPGTGKSLGQGQEEGRDQGHSALDVLILGVIGKQAWSQGVDLFGYDDNRILWCIEYFARYNLGNEVPFVEYTNEIVVQHEISSVSRGDIRPTWELLYNHYVVVKGLDAPWTKKYLDYALSRFGGFEPGAGSLGEGSGHYDGFGWGSLLYRSHALDALS